MSAVADIGQLISRDPSIRGGRPCIAGTGVSVRRIVGWHRLGLSPDEISDRIGHVSLAQVHAALAYYFANRDEVDRDIAEEERTVERLQQAAACDRIE
jgi:uncharacterized protein (DUF433 family)